MPLQPMSDNFDINVNWEDVPDNDLLPESTYELMILKADMGWTATEKLAVEVTYEVGAGELEGKRMRAETFTLGDEQDNQGIHPETRMRLFGWMNLKRLCNAIGVRYEQSLRMTTRQMEGMRFLATVKCVTQPDKQRDGQPNPYAGQQQNRVTAYYPVGHSAQIPAQSNGVRPPISPPIQGVQPQRRMSAMEMIASQQSGHVAEGSVAQEEPEDDIPQ